MAAAIAMKRRGWDVRDVVASSERPALILPTGLCALCGGEGGERPAMKRGSSDARDAVANSGAD